MSWGESFGYPNSWYYSNSWYYRNTIMNHWNLHKKLMKSYKSYKTFKITGEYEGPAIDRWLENFYGNKFYDFGPESVAFIRPLEGLWIWMIIADIWREGPTSWNSISSPYSCIMFSIRDCHLTWQRDGFNTGRNAIIPEDRRWKFNHRQTSIRRNHSEIQWENPLYILP